LPREGPRNIDLRARRRKGEDEEDEEEEEEKRRRRRRRRKRGRKRSCTNDHEGSHGHSTLHGEGVLGTSSAVVQHSPVFKALNPRS